MSSVNRISLGAGYAVVVGAFMLGFWAVLYATGGGPALSYDIGYHLVAESSTALALLATGTGILRGRSWAARLYPVALGMLLYTVLNSAGYYAQRGEAAMVGMFTLITVATLLALFDYLGRPTWSTDPQIRPEDVDA